MELGQYQLQIFVGLVVVLAAAFVALICDFLKGNNEQLRELTIELKVRREEEQRHARKMTSQTISADTPAIRERIRMERVETERAEQRIEAPVPRAMAAPAPRAMAAPAGGKEAKRPPSADALAAMERGARLAAAPRKKTAAPPEIQPNHAQTPTEEHIPVAAQTPSAQAAPAVATTRPVTLVAQSSVMKHNEVQHSLVQHSVAKPSAVHPSVIKPNAAQSATGASKKDWGSLLARTAKPTRPVATLQREAWPEEVREVLQDTVAAASSTTTQPADGAAVPAGFHEGYVLSRLVQSRQPVSGLVVSIGVNTPRNSDGSMPEPVRKLMESLIGPGDFACQSSSEEFLLIYPNERGASAQRRLSEIAQQLWDFQLRCLGSFSILFTWGGVEVLSESIDEAIASANERMHETRRGRKLLTMEPRGEQQLRQAV